VRLAALQSVLNTGAASLSGYPRPRRRCGFPRVLVARRPVSSPVSLRRRVHPLLSLASSSEYEPLPTCPSHGCDERLPWGLPSQSRYQPWRSTREQGSQPRSRFRPRCFAHPRRFALSTTWRACFIPLTTSGIRLSGVCSRHLARPPRRRPLALLSLTTVSCRHVAAAAPDPATSPSGR